MYKTNNGEEHKVETRKKRELNEICDELGIDKKMIDTFYEPENAGHAIHTMKLRLNSVVNALNTTQEMCEVYLSDVTNFRYQVNCDYKANRVGNRIPANLGVCKQYLVDYWDARIIPNYEADDALGLIQMMHFTNNHKEDTTCICTIDKDLDMIPGWHYNWMHKKKYWITPEEAVVKFYRQLLKGDKVDNIIGLKGIGDKRSETIIAGCKNEEDMFYTCLEKYIQETGDHGAALDRMLTNGNLLWILQQKEVYWTDHIQKILNSGTTDYDSFVTRVLKNIN